MYAIVETGGKQYWVTPGETIKVHKLDASAGAEVQLKVLWAAEEKQSENNSSQKAQVKAEILRQLKGPKILVFKKRPKSRYRRSRGHRQDLTEIKIKEISLN